jgi:N-acetylglutamate synthase-like GNAT family acetyltransferase
MKYSLRPATSQEAAAIRRLVLSGRINPTGLDWRRFLIAVGPDGNVIGCGQVKPHADGTRELASIVVDPESRGQGLARAIIERLLADNPGELYLMCRAELEGLYEKFGFRWLPPEQLPKYFRRISRLAGVLDSLRRQGTSLLVMKRG